MTNFNKYVEGFETILASEAEEQILDGKNVVAFIGRESCPFCQIFAPKISNVVKKLNTPAIFINSENFNDSGLDGYRRKYNIKTVPGLLVAKDGVVKVVCDSSLSEEKILEFITK